MITFQHAVKELLDFFELPRVSVELLKQKAKQKLRLLAAAGKEKIEAAFAKHRVSSKNLSSFKKSCAFSPFRLNETSLHLVKDKSRRRRHQSVTKSDALDRLPLERI